MKVEKSPRNRSSASNASNNTSNCTSKDRLARSADKQSVAPSKSGIEATPPTEAENPLVCFLNGTFDGSLDVTFQGGVKGMFKGDIRGIFKGSLIGRIKGDLEGDFYDATIRIDDDSIVVQAFAFVLDSHQVGTVKSLHENFYGGALGTFDGSLIGVFLGSLKGTFKGTLTPSDVELDHECVYRHPPDVNS